MSESTDGSEAGKKRAKTIPEWRRYGDPRNVDGHFRPKRNLRTLYGKGRKWTRESLAAAMGMKDPSLISKWATGVRYMYDEDVVRCSMAAGVSVPWLLDLSARPQAQGWPRDYVTRRTMLLGEIRKFSNGKTWNELAKDYQIAMEVAAAFDAEFEAKCLELSGLASFDLFTLAQQDEQQGDYYDELAQEAYQETQREPWYYRDEGDEYHPAETIEYLSDDISGFVDEIERGYPGDYRDAEHIALAMTREVVRYYPIKFLEDTTGLLSQAARMSRSE